MPVVDVVRSEVRTQLVVALEHFEVEGIGVFLMSSEVSPAFRAASRMELWHSPAKRKKRELTKCVKMALIARINDIMFFHGNDRRSHWSKSLNLQVLPKD